MTHPGTVSELSETRVAAEQAVREAVVAQLADADPHYLDLHAWGDTYVAMTRRLAELARAMGAQVRDYGSRRLLHDAEGADPAARLAMVAGHLDELHRALETARAAAVAYQAEIANVRITVDPDAQRRPGRNEIDHEVMPYWPGLAPRPPDDETD